MALAVQPHDTVLVGSLKRGPSLITCRVRLQKSVDGGDSSFPGVSRQEAASLAAGSGPSLPQSSSLLAASAPPLIITLQTLPKLQLPAQPSRETGGCSLPPLPSSGRGCFFSCVGCVCWVVLHLEGRFLPPGVMRHAESRLHICLLGGSGRGKQNSACACEEGVSADRSGVMGLESRELTPLAVCRGSGRLIIGLGPTALDVGVRSCVRTWLSRWE